MAKKQPDNQYPTIDPERVANRHHHLAVARILYVNALLAGYLLIILPILVGMYKGINIAPALLLAGMTLFFAMLHSTNNMVGWMEPSGVSVNTVKAIRFSTIIVYGACTIEWLYVILALSSRFIVIM